MPEMTLLSATEEALPLRSIMWGSTTINVINENLVIKNGEDIFFKGKPVAGKKWECSINLRIIETEV